METTQAVRKLNRSEDKPDWYLPPDSKVRAVALTIMAMRAAGKSDDEIATELGISRKSISPYVYRAAKNGWLVADSPMDRVKYELLNRVVERLGEGLEDGARHQTSGMRVRTAVALKMAEGTIFREFEQNGASQTQSTIVAVQVIMPPGGQQTMREDTAGGTPNYVEAELAK
jgi:predicted transcriptional regulator